MNAFNFVHFSDVIKDTMQRKKKQWNLLVAEAGDANKKGDAKSGIAFAIVHIILSV